MRAPLISVLGISTALMWNSRVSASEQPLELSSAPAFEIKTMIAPNGARFHAVRCRPGAPHCTYDWNSLCHASTIRNATKDGKISESATFIRDADGEFMRLFVCKARP